MQVQLQGKLSHKNSDIKILDFIIELTANTYSNYSSIELVLLIQFTKKPAKATEMDADVITVNISFWTLDNRY